MSGYRSGDLPNWLAGQRAKNAAEGVGDNLLTPPPAAVRPIWAPNNPVGTSNLLDQSISMPSPDVSPVMDQQPWWAATPLTVAKHAKIMAGAQYARDQLDEMLNAETVGRIPARIALASRGLPGERPPMPVGPADVASIRAFHGSPYDFQAFDTSKIGTGEGAQAYGYGHYAAGAEGTARFYRDALTPTDRGFDAMDTVLRRFSGGNPTAADVKEALTGHDVLTPLAENADVVDAVRRLSPDYNPSAAVTGDALRHYRTINDAIEAAAPKGKMYELAIHADPEHFLDWDKPLSEQSQHVQDAIKKAGLKPTEPDLGSFGGSPVRGAPRWADTAEQAQQLRDAGIPGIKYLDQGSRGKGEGTSNYVIFDPATIEILRKYGIAGLMAGGAAAATQPSSSDNQ